MTGPADDPVLVVGGGAAGIAAARTLRDAGRSTVILEASDRLGGRARSARVRDLIDPARSHPDWLPRFDGDAVVDLGCGWLHSAARNPWVAIAEASGVAIDRTAPGWGRQWRDLGYSAADQAAFAAAYAEWDEAAHALLSLPDRSLADVPASPRWRPMLNAISGWANGADAAAVSLHDWAAYDDAAGEDNWALPGGYGSLIVDHAHGLPHRLDCPVHRIDHRDHVVRVETDHGTLAAAAVIVCVAPTVLHRIEFTPALPDKLAAAAALPLGLADKVFVAVDRPEWPRQAHLIGAPFADRTASHRLSPFGLPIIETFLGGGAAEALASEADACAFALDDLVGVLGGDWRARLHPLAATHWRGVAHVEGSYSHARVGQSARRRVLAEPVDDRLFFAGEACHSIDYSTAHGAYATGRAAALAAIAALPVAA